MEMSKHVGIYIMYKDTVVIYKGTGKAVPFQAWSGPEGSRN